MKKYAIYAFMLLLGISNSLIAQENGIIEGRLFNAKNNEPIPFANIVIWGTQIGAVSDLDGNFIFTGVKPGYVELRASAIGFETTITPDVFVTNAKKAYIDIPMNETQVALDEVVVKASPFRRSEESPVSLRRIGIAEIEKNPGGNRDISRVIQSLPGVASTPAFRNDVIVR
ncbi:MAG: carboxypeptidase-like regulatory domain-containing protein, partial [Bacteroidota bacterium]